MHEGHFTEQIVATIIQELKKYPGRKPKRVKVTVGEVYHLVPESVVMHYELISKGTMLEGAVLDLVEEPMRVQCRACGRDGSVEDHHLLLCSFCLSRDVVPIAGDRVTIEQVELDSP